MQGIKHRKCIAQYGLDGNLVKVYNSQLDAKKDTGISNYDISSVVRGGRSKTAGGFQWRYWNPDLPLYVIPSIENSIERMVRTKCKEVLCLDSSNSIVGRYRSLNDAHRFAGCSGPTLKKHINNGMMCNGFIWKYNEQK
jgi:hypothetical protein